ncbi:MAG: hypothetical protein ABEN55_00430 [Bradymonadaceae bacterium]
MSKRKEITERLAETVNGPHFRRFDDADEANEACREMTHGRIVVTDAFYAVMGLHRAKYAADAGLDVRKLV